MFESKFLISNLTNDEELANKVIFVGMHTKNIAQGFILNAEKVGKVGYTNLLELFETPDKKSSRKFDSVPIYKGGPVKTNGIYLLHGYEEFYQPKPAVDLQIMEGVYFGTPAAFAAIIESGKLQENKFKFYAGTCDWSAGQLEKEVENGLWTVVDAKRELFFDEIGLSQLIENNRNKKPKIWSIFGFDLSGFNPSLN
jgi:putative transcriptional regulator